MEIKQIIENNGKRQYVKPVMEVYEMELEVGIAGSLTGSGFGNAGGTGRSSAPLLSDDEE